MALGPCSSDRPDRARPVTSEPETSTQREIVVMAQLALQEKWRGRGWTVMKKRMGTTARAIFVSLIAAISSSAIPGFFLVFVMSPSGTPPEPPVLLVGLTFSLLAVPAGLPLSVPLGIVGGLCAAAFLRRELSQTRNRWIGLGGVSGLAVGGLGATVYPFLIGELSLPPREVLLIYLSLGSVSGLFAGAAVGLWCARVMRSTQDGTGPGPGGKRPSPTSSRPSAPAPG